MAFVATALVSIVILAACNGNDDDAGNDNDSAGIDVDLGEMVFEPDTITAVAGSALTINLENVDGQFHDFTIDDFDGDQVQVRLDPDETDSITLELPDAATEFTFYCSVPGHQALGMEGTIVVE